MLPGTSTAVIPAVLSSQASENVMGGLPLPPLPSARRGSGGAADTDGAEGQRRREEDARLIAQYKLEFVQSWREEQQQQTASPSPFLPVPAASASSAPLALDASQPLVRRLELRVQQLEERLSQLAAAAPLTLPGISHARMRARLPSAGPSGATSSSAGAALESDSLAASLFPVKPAFAVSTLLSLSPAACRHAWLQYRSLHRHAPFQYDYVIVYETADAVSEWRLLTSEPHCRLLYALSYDFAASAAAADPPPVADSAAVGRVRFLPVRPLALPWWARARFERWTYCYHKLRLLELTDYRKLLYLDEDVLVLAPVAAFFSLPFDVAAGLDTAQSCEKAPGKMNAGVLLVTPSLRLHAAFLSALQQPAASCISGHLEEAEQELLNCLCGFGLERAQRPLRPDLRCGLLPAAANVVPSYSVCADYSDDEAVTVHFADLPKPWDWTDEADALCRSIAVNATWQQPDDWFLQPERSRCFTGQRSFLVLYRCMEGAGEAEQRSLGMPDCRLVSLDQQRRQNGGRASLAERWQDSRLQEPESA